MKWNKGTLGNYWTVELDDWVEMFNNAQNVTVRNQIYEEKLRYPFEKLSECTLNSFNFNFIEEQAVNTINDGVSFLLMKCGQYQSKKGKSFSFFSYIIKNYYINLNRGGYKNTLKMLKIDSLEENEKENVLFNADVDSIQSEDIDDIDKFTKLLIGYFERNFDIIFVKPMHKTFGKAFLQLLNERTDITIKRHLFSKIKSLTNLNAPQISRCLSIVKNHYRIFRRHYLNGNVDFTPPSYNEVCHYRNFRAWPSIAKRKGVQRRGGKWFSVLYAKGKAHYLGTFNDPQSASEAYKREHAKVFGNKENA